MFTTHFVRDAEDTENSFFPFTFEMKVNENHPKLRFIRFICQDTRITIRSIIRFVPCTVRLVITIPALSRRDESPVGEELGFISFRPLSEKK